MSADRRSYRREPEEKRREALIAAAQALVAEGGPKAATVRAIADKAGVTAGLIRHYFASKEDLTRAAYLAHMDGMTDTNIAALELAGSDPAARLAAFVAASLRAPVMGGGQVGLWAGFLHTMRTDPAMLGAHEAGYLRYRDRLQALIADLPRPAGPAQLRADAIACNAVIDGLWLEGSILPRAFAPDELALIALSAIGAIVGIDLMPHAEHALRPPAAADDAAADDAAAADAPPDAPLVGDASLT